MATHIEKDDVSGTATTGHTWDGIKELNTPLPKWWLYTFYACVIWAIGYTILYPAWPLPGGATRGVLGWTSRGQLEEQMATVAASQKETVDKIAAMSLPDIMKDPKLLAYAQAGGAAAFKVALGHGGNAQDRARAVERQAVIAARDAPFQHFTAR